MSDADMLKALIEKAIKGGWKLDQYEYPGLLGADWEEPANQQLIPWLIFNREFAKALFGDRKAGTEYLGQPMIRQGWQYHLQQAVVSDNPINYMYKHAIGDKS